MRTKGMFRMLSLLLCLSIVLGMAPAVQLLANVSAAEPAHADHGTHDGWIGVDAAYLQTNGFPAAGNVYLTRDVSLPAGVSVTGELHLCLNGNTLTGAVVPYLSIANGATLTLCDCSAEADGTISGSTITNNTSDQGMIKVNTGATLNMYGGIVTDYATTASYGAVRVQGTFNMHGGLIAGNTAGRGAGVSVYKGTFKMNGGQIGAENAPNQAQYGAAIYGAGDATIEINGGSICYNLAEKKDAPTENAGGSAIYSNATSTLTITGGTISNNVSRHNSSPDKYVTIHGAGLTVNMSGGTIKDNTGLDDDGTPVGAVALFLQAASVSGGYAYPAANISGNPVVGDEGIVFKSANIEKLNITALKKGASILSSAALTTSDSTVLTDVDSVPGLKLYKQNPVLFSEDFESYEAGATAGYESDYLVRDGADQWRANTNNPTASGVVFPSIVSGVSHDGNKSALVHDALNNGSMQLRTVNAISHTEPAGTELIATVWHKADGETLNKAYARLYIGSATYDARATSSGEWEKLTIIGTTTAANQGLQVFFVSNGADVTKTYYDDLTIQVLTTDLALAYLEELLSAAEPNATAVLTVLQTKALSLQNVNADKVDNYIASLKTAGTGLTKEAVQFCIDNPGATVPTILFSEDFESYAVGSVALNASIGKNGVSIWQAFSNKDQTSVPALVTPSITTEDAHGGTKSALVYDATDAASLQLRMPSAIVANSKPAGTEIIATVWHKSDGGNAYMRMTLGSNYDVTVTSDGEWEPLSVIGTTTAASQNARIWFVSNSGDVTKTYYDDLTVQVLTEELALAYIEEKLAPSSPSADMIQKVLVTKALNLVGLDASLKTQYTAELKAARSASSAALTKAQVQACIDTANFKALVDELADADEIEIGVTGPISIPVELPNGVTAQWSAVSPESGKITVSEGAATVTAVPGDQDPAEHYTMTLTLSCNGASENVTLPVKLINNSELSAKLLQETKDALLKSGTVIGISATGSISLPAGYDKNGVAAQWSAINVNPENRLALDNGVLSAVSLPAGRDYVEATVTLKITKDSAEDTIEYTLVIYDPTEHILMDMPNPSFELLDDNGYAEGWIPHNLATDYIYTGVATDVSRTGSNSLFIYDTQPKQSTGAKYAVGSVPAEVGYDYVATVWAKGNGTGGGIIYLYFYKNATTSNKSYATSFGQFPVNEETWIQSSVRGTATSGSVYINVMPYSNQAGVGTVYYDDFRVWKITAAGILAEIDAELTAAEGNAETLYARLDNGAISVGTLVSTSKAQYLAELKALRATKGAALTDAELKAAVEQINATVAVDDQALVNAAVAEISTTMSITSLGEISLPQITTQGVDLVWTKVENDANHRILLTATSARTVSLPATGEAAEQAQLTLTVSRGQFSAKVTVAVTLNALTDNMSALAAAAGELDLNDYLNGQDPAYITENLSALPTSLGDGISVSWKALNTNRVTASAAMTNDGVVTRPGAGEDDSAVLLQAALTKNGETYTCDFYLLVPAIDADETRELGHWDKTFETPYSDPIAAPKGWLKTDLYNKTDPVVKSEVAAIVNEHVFIGSNALLLTTTAADNGELRSEFDLTAREGYLYKLQAMVYTETSANPTITISFWDNEGLLLSSAVTKYLDQNQDAGVWKNLSVSGIAPVGTAAVTATLTGAANTVYFDNVRLREYPTVTNGSFALGAAGWETEGTVAGGKLTLAAQQTAVSDVKAAIAGAPYVLKVTGSGSAVLRFLKGTQTLKDFTATNGKIFAYAPADADGLQIILSGQGTFDDIRLVFGGYGTTVADGSFESSAAGTSGTPWKLYNAVIGNDTGVNGSAGITVSAGGSATSNPIPIIEGKDYIISGDVFGNGSIELQYHTIGNTGGQVKGTTVSHSGSTWKNLVIDASQLSDGTQDYATEYVVIVLHANGGEARFDNIQIKTVSNSVSNSSAETVLRGGYGTFATNWETFGSGIAYMANQAGEATEGFKSIALELFGFGEAGIRSSVIRGIVPGKEYEAAIQAKGTGAELAIKFLDADMKALSIKTVPINSNNWTEYSVTAEAPANAAYAVLVVLGSGEGKVYIDEAQIVPVVKEIKSNTQLFLDDYMIHSSSNVDRVYHDGTKYTDPNGNATFVYPGDFGSYAQIYGTVLYDADRSMYNEPDGAKGIFRMWYQSGGYRTSYAESKDGITWVAPALNLATINGSKNNNICNIKGTDSPSISVFAVFKDEDETDPNKLYKMVTHNRQHSVGVGMYELWYSADGLSWERYGDIMAGHDVASVIYDEANDLYVGTFKNTLNTKRVHHITVSRDLINWSQPIPMGSIDTLIDSAHYLRTDSYGYGAVALGDSYVGFDWRFLINEGTMGGISDVVLMFSRDVTEDWQRLYHANGESVLAVPLGKDGAFDDGFIDTASTSINVGDETWLYYGGWDGDHQSGIVRTTKIGLVKWRLNGFGSMNFGSTEGTLETSKFTFTGSELHVNAKVNGSLKIELLNSTGAVVDTATITGDNVDHVITWAKGTNLGYMEGQTVALRFTGTNAELYSFETTGESVTKPTVKVTFDSDVAEQELAYGSSAVEPTAPVKAGFTFAGWYNGNVLYDFSSAVIEDVVLTAKWTVNKFTVSFDSGVASQTVDYGGKATKPANPTKEGYTFIGWYNGETAYDFNAAVTGSFSLTAKWTINKYTVSFDSGVVSQTVEHGAKATKPADPTKEGFNFVGWYKGETAYDFNTAVTGSISLTAKWVEKVTIPVSGEENTIHVDVTVEDDVVTVQPIDPEELDEVIGADVETGDVVIDLTELDKEIGSVVLPKEVVEQILDAAQHAQNDTEHLVIKLPDAVVELDDKTMHVITETAEGDVALVVEVVEAKDLNDTQKTALKDKKTFGGIDVYLVCTVSGEKIADFEGGKATVKVPFQIPANHKAEGFSVWYVAEDGKLTKMETKYESGHLVFSTGHFSDYIIIYEEPAPEGNQPGGSGSGSGSTGNDDPSKTGDNTMMPSFLLLAALSITALAVIFIGKKRLF